MKKRLLTEIANDIGNDNKSVDGLIDTIMKNVEKWAKEHKGELKKLTPEQRERLTQPTYLVRQIAEIRYAREYLKERVVQNLRRTPGNLCEEDKVLGFYDTLEKFNYSCPYSDTLLIGGEQPIHLEHIIPVTMGGPTDDWNCIPVCENCNESKGDRHLLDWWQDNRTVEEEYKLVKIFEHITSKLLDNSNQIRYVETKDNTKHLDVITFLHQLLDHIEQNKQYILGPNSSILDDNSKAIESKLKELKKTFERVVKKNSDKTLKTDKQYFKEQKQILTYVKSLGVRSYYKIAYTYFTEIQEMLNNGTSEEEIRLFCFDKDDSFNFTLFYQKLIKYKEKHGSFAGVTNNKEIGYTASNLRQAYKGKNNQKLTQEMIDKLDAIGFPWVGIKDWFTPLFEKLIEYRDNEIIDKNGKVRKPKGSFAGVSNNEELKSSIANIRQAYKYKDDEEKRKAKGLYNLTEEMIKELDEIGFTWEQTDWFTPFYEKLIMYRDKEIIDKDGMVVKPKGSFALITADKEIGNIAKHLRKAYIYKDLEEKPKYLTKLTQEMIDKLDEVGFVWKVEKEDWFTPFFKKLIEYKDKEIVDKNGNIKKIKGSFDFVTKDKEIGTIVNRVRKAYKYKDLKEKPKHLTKLTQEMIDKLDEVGFVWKVEKEDWFTPFYEKLIEYKENNNGDFSKITKEETLKGTVYNIRRAYKYINVPQNERPKGLWKLTRHIIDKLDEIGFPWEARAKKVKEDVLSV